MESLGQMSKVSFSAVIRIEGINPYVDPPLGTGKKLGRDRGVVPVRVLLDGKPFLANLVPLGPKRTRAAPGTHHRLYLHGIIRKTVGKDPGDRIRVILQLDLKPRVEPMNPALARGLKKNAKAKAIFQALSHSRRKEILRYLNHLKTPETLRRTTQKVLAYLRNPLAKPKAHQHVIVRSVAR
jgi:hypothetical protein